MVPTSTSLTPATGQPLRFPNMSKAVSESSEDFEYVETPAAPTPEPPAEDFGVRTTAVANPLEKVVFSKIFAEIQIVPSHQECTAPSGCVQ